MQVKKMALSSAVLFLGIEISCSFFKTKLYEYKLANADQALVVYRIPADFVDARLELRLESRWESTVLHSYDEAAWFDMACAAAVMSPDRPILNYLIATTDSKVYIGAYDLNKKHKLHQQDIDVEALRREIRRLYSGFPQFPEDNIVDLLEWATDINSCKEAFTRRFPQFSQ